MSTMELTRGNMFPEITLLMSDTDNEADFSDVSASECLIKGELRGVVVIEDTADTIDVAPDNHSAVVTRAWGTGETDVAGIMWFTVDVEFESGKRQTFGPMPVHIRRAPGDA